MGEGKGGSKSKRRKEKDGERRTGRGGDMLVSAFSLSFARSLASFRPLPAARVRGSDGSKEHWVSGKAGKSPILHSPSHIFL